MWLGADAEGTLQAMTVMKDYASRADRLGHDVKPSSGQVPSPAPSEGDDFGWGGLIGLIVLLTFAGVFGKEFGAGIISNISPRTETSLEATLSQIAERMNQRAPIRVDDMTELKAATAGPGRQFRYIYTVLAVPNVPKSSTELVSMMRPTVMRSYCHGDTMELIRESSVVVTYEYRDSQQRPLGSITLSPQDCRP